jgi:FKBP12-rapamycin complex-associated protein
LDERFDTHLAQAENVRSLFIALNDEVFAIRELAITIIGRLTVHNPAYVMPSLRKTLIQLLTELEYSAIRHECNADLFMSTFADELHFIQVGTRKRVQDY